MCNSIFANRYPIRFPTIRNVFTRVMGLRFYLWFFPISRDTFKWAYRRCNQDAQFSRLFKYCRSFTFPRDIRSTCGNATLSKRVNRSRRLGAAKITDARRQFICLFVLRRHVYSNYPRRVINLIRRTIFNGPFTRCLRVTYFCGTNVFLRFLGIKVRATLSNFIDGRQCVSVQFFTAIPIDQ